VNRATGTDRARRPPAVAAPPGRVGAGAATPSSAGRDALRRFAVRGAITQVNCLVVALLYFLIERDRGSFGVTWLYAAAIGTCCWLLIDGGRLALSAVLRRRARSLSLAGLLGCIAVGTPVGFALGHGLVDVLLGHGPQALFHDGPALAVSLLAALAASFYFRVHERLRDARMAAESARRIAAEHELKLLESQLEPHMLFNTLANLRVLIALDPVRAQHMLDRLVAFLRAMLGASRAGAQHPLADEFARIDDYLELMRVRMGERLQTRFVLPAELRAAPVPPFLLQPLVENAIRHGLEPQVAGGRIEVVAAREGEQLVLRVRDTGVGIAGPAAEDSAGGASDGGGAACAAAGGDTKDQHAGHAAHFGLTQVRERLASLHGAAASLRLAPVADAEGGTLATVRLPCPAADPTAVPTRPAASP